MVIYKHSQGHLSYDSTVKGFNFAWLEFHEFYHSVFHDDLNNYFVYTPKYFDQYFAIVLFS